MSENNQSSKKAQSYFFSTVSHDFRTPLNAIVGYAQMLKLGIKDEEERTNAINSILTSSNLLLQLVNDILDLSKLEAGKLEINLEPTDCVRLVTDVVNAFRATGQKKGVEVIAEVSPMPILEIDPQRIRQILFNLIGNSMKFTDQGEIRVFASYDEGNFRLRIRDTGCGIAEEDLPKLGSPYVQVGNGHGRNGGTGLGLAIVKQLVFLMHGRIDIESGIGWGTEFTIEIPNIEKSHRGANLLSTTQKIQAVMKDPSKNYEKVLIVDDAPMNLTMLRAMLKAFGVNEVTTATNGCEALEILKESEVDDFDLVLTDLWMPEMDGHELVSKIRELPTFGKIPVYAVTADTEADAGLAESGFTGLLLKPVTLEKLKAVLGGYA